MRTVVVALGLVVTFGCEVQEPPKKASGSIVEALPRSEPEPEPVPERALHPDLRAPGGDGGLHRIAPDLKPLDPPVDADDPEASPDELPADPPLHPDLKPYPTN